MRIAQIQTKVFDDIVLNLVQMQREMDALSGKAIDLVCFGEMFVCPYDSSNFRAYAEPEGGKAWQFCSRMAKEHGVYLSAGSVPEIDEEGRVYNTAYVFDREGRQIGKHRKMHLFDIAVEGGQHFQESASLTAGDLVTVFDTDLGRMGLCICFDCRFPELLRLMVLQGAKVILVPAAFNLTTGPAHWSVMFRSRAIDNQCFMIGTSDARDMDAAYHAYGHSLVVSPWGEVVSEMDEQAGTCITEIDLSQVEAIRRQLPLLSARRTDLYSLESK